MAKYFIIDGYFNDDNTEFTGFIVKDTNDVEESEDDDVFFYGLSEDDIKRMIEEPTPEFEFTITKYEKL